MLKPFYLLEGHIDRIKEIRTSSTVETIWEDENGDRAIVIKLKGVGDGRR